MTKKDFLFSPDAVAEMKGSPEYPDIYGKVYFYQTDMGVVVSAEIDGLAIPSADCKNGIFALHIYCLVTMDMHG